MHNACDMQHVTPVLTVGNYHDEKIFPRVSHIHRAIWTRFQSRFDHGRIKNMVLFMIGKTALPVY